MRLEKFTTRKSPATGKPYPRCQVSLAGLQCERTVYSDSMCWKHYRQDAPEIFAEKIFKNVGRPRKAKV